MSYLGAPTPTGLIIDRYQPMLEDAAEGKRGRDVIPAALSGGPGPYVVYAIRITEKTGRFERS